MKFFKDLSVNEETELYPYAYPKLFEKVLKILKENKWQIMKQDKDEGFIELRTGWSMYSYGESIQITFHKVSNKGTRINVISKNVGGTFIGFIKDHKNIVKLMHQFDESLRKC